MHYLFSIWARAYGLTLLPSFSEKKIDEIAQNVDGIRQLLQGLGIRAFPGAPSSTPRVHQGALHPETNSQDSRKTQAFDYDERDSLFHAQSKLTGQFVSELIDFGPFSQPNANRNAIMESLQEILASGDENNLEGSETADVAMTGFFDSLELPPQEEAVIVLRWARGESYQLLHSRRRLSFEYLLIRKYPMLYTILACSSS